MSRIRRLLLLVTLSGLSVFGTGCAGRRVVLVPPGEPVQLAEPAKAYVYVQVDGKRERSRSRVTLPEGWWVLPDPGE